MTPVIKHLKTLFPDLPVPDVQDWQLWTFEDSIQQMGPEFYSKILPLHPALLLEYSVLCNQINDNFLSQEIIHSEDTAIDQVTSALLLAQLLEHIHTHYLIVPRESARLRLQQETYKAFLSQLALYTFPSDIPEVDAAKPGLSHHLRETTVQANWLRLLLTRSKRLINLLELVTTNSEHYRHFVAFIDKFTNPFFSYLAWCFFLPRFVLSLFLVAKHSIPGPWMKEDEHSLGWATRLKMQLQRRWFELGNDIIWITVGLLNCFLLVGPLAPFTVYLSLFAFAFDVFNTAMRAYIEVERLNGLRKEYTIMLQGEGTEESKQDIKDYLQRIDERIHFERKRLSIGVASTSIVLIAMCLSLPVLALPPIIPVVSAFFLIAAWIASFTVTRVVEQQRPKDTVDKAQLLSKVGLFAAKSIPEPVPKLESEIHNLDFLDLPIYNFSYGLGVDHSPNES